MVVAVIFQFGFVGLISEVFGLPVLGVSLTYLTLVGVGCAFGFSDLFFCGLIVGFCVLM